MSQPHTDLEDDDAQASFPAASALSGNDLLLWSALPDLTLNIAQTAALCGVSVRQLGYWTKQGYIKASGNGARRLYGPDSLRRILAIRHAMQSGLSLRQSLRALDEAPPVASLPPPTGARDSIVPANPALSPGDAGALAASLLALFDRNCQTRDNASGLAAKLGRATEDVRRIAEQLAAQGALMKIPAGGEAVFARAEGRRL